MHYHFGISYFRRLYLWLGMMVVLLSATPVFAAGLNGACGASNGGLFPVAPTTGLCSAGTPTAVIGDGLWKWDCTGVNGGANQNCTAGMGASAKAVFPTAPVPKTGQTDCYGVASCEGSGQDGESQAGFPWPNPRFSDNGDQTVTDKLTGLVWTKDANPAAATKTWQEALDYIKSLNSSNYLGRSDWRLPNVNELKSLINLGQANPAGWLNGQGFVNVQAYSYWSSNSSAYYPSFAWFVVMDSGFVSYNYKTYNYHVWPVRAGQSGSFDAVALSETGQNICHDSGGAAISCEGSGQDGELQSGAAWPDPRFTDNSNLTVTDNLTGLVWTKDANPAATTKTWQGALDYIKVLNSSSYLGYDDWRLPNHNELESLINWGQINAAGWLNGQGFVNAQAYYYWSSSSHANITNDAWIVSMDDGSVSSFNYKADYFYVWPVRAGQFWAFDALILSAPARFGRVPLNLPPPPRQIGIKNRGTIPQAVTSIAISGAHAAEFSIASGGDSPCGSLSPTLSAGESCTLLLGFSPASSGAKTAALDITANGTTNQVPLSGTGIATIHGVVTDQSSGLPVSGATVTTNTAATTTTDTNGSYRFDDLPAATYSISISKTGYQTASRNGLVIHPTTSAKADILLPTTGYLNITTPMLPSATAGQAYSSRVMVTGGTAPYTFSKDGRSLPAGLTLDSASGTISGTPGGSGSYSFTIRVTDSLSAFSETDYTIYLVPTLQITTAVLTRGISGNSYGSAIVAAGGKPPYSYAVTSGRLPDGLVLDPATGLMGGTAATSGTFNRTVTVSDSTGRKISKTFTIGIDAPLTITDMQISNGIVNIPYSKTVGASGGYGAYDWSITSGTLPAGLSLNPSTGTISGTRTVVGNQNITVRVQDLAGRVFTQNYTLKIAAPLLIQTAALPYGLLSNPYNTGVITSGGVAPVTVTLSGQLPAGLVLDQNSGVISGIPSSASSMNFGITATDSSYPTPQVISKNMSLKIWSQQPQAVTLLFGGTGGGDVNCGMNCSTGQACAPMLFAKDSTLTLMATPDTESLFDFWSGNCSGTGNCQLTMDSAKTVTANFSYVKPTRINRAVVAPFDTLIAAYAAANSGETIQARWFDFASPAGLILGRNISVTIKGGYNAAYSANPDMTTIQGPLVLQGGAVTVEGVTVR